MTDQERIEELEARCAAMQIVIRQLAMRAGPAFLEGVLASADAAGEIGIAYEFTDAQLEMVQATLRMLAGR